MPRVEGCVGSLFLADLASSFSGLSGHLRNASFMGNSSYLTRQLHEARSRCVVPPPPNVPMHQPRQPPGRVLVYSRGPPPSGVPGPLWKEKCPGPRVQCTNTNDAAED